MRTRHSRIAAAVLAVAAGGLAAFALRPAAGNSTGTVAARNPAVEVRTQVIRRTVHVIRHEPAAALRGSRSPTSIVVGGHGPSRGGAHVARTGASGARRSAVGAGATPPAVATRASGRHSGTGVSGPGVSSAPVSTRASGSHSGTSAGSPGRAVTRSSGGGQHGGDDGGDGHGGDD
jgi:hypothetical protein